MNKPIHEWFELTYAQFLTVPRLVMESMPAEWQEKMVSLLREMDETFDWRPKEGRYWVKLRDAQGKYTSAPLSDYRHGSCEHLRRPGKSPNERPEPCSICGTPTLLGARGDAICATCALEILESMYSTDFDYYIDLFRATSKKRRK